MQKPLHSSDIANSFNYQEAQDFEAQDTKIQHLQIGNPESTIKSGAIRIYRPKKPMQFEISTVRPQSSVLRVTPPSNQKPEMSLRDISESSVHSAVVNTRVRDSKRAEQNNQSAFYDDEAIFAEKLDIQRAGPEQTEYNTKELEGAVRKTTQAIVPNYDIISATISRTKPPAKS